MPDTLSYFDDGDHFVTNFDPLRDDFSRHLRIAGEMGYRAWMGVHERILYRASREWGFE